MPRITITEHSDTYSYQVRNNSYATVALPITAIWGPAYVADSKEANPDWIHFSAGYKGTTDFMNTFKGPNTYLGVREKSYDYALKLLGSGYDILVKRVDGLSERATLVKTFAPGSEETAINIRIVAKYAGSYANKIKVALSCNKATKLGTVLIKEVSNLGTETLLETCNVAFSNDTASSNVPLITEAEYAYIDRMVFENGDGIEVSPETAIDRLPTTAVALSWNFSEANAVDYITHLVDSASGAITKAAILNLISARKLNNTSFYSYMDSVVLADSSEENLRLTYNQQILYSRAEACIEELTDPLGYDWDVLFCGIMDDQYLPKNYINSQSSITYGITSLVVKMFDVAAASKCGCAFVGTPFNMPKEVTGTGIVDTISYKNALSETLSTETLVRKPDAFRTTYGELVGPWCKTTLPISGENSWITPEVAHLLLIINAQGIGGVNKWWMIPAGMSTTNVVHTPEYKIKKAYLDLIQNHDEGICMNPLMEVSGRGFTCFGNSTLWDKPLGTYNALQNLSTRLLCNRVKQRIFDTALQILFRYNNADAYAHFYAGLSPLLDEMRSVGALTGNDYNPYGYKIIMNPDVVNLDRINANTAIGKVYLAVTGVIDDVQVDLYLLPPTGFMDTYD